MSSYISPNTLFCLSLFLVVVVLHIILCKCRETKKRPSRSKVQMVTLPQTKQNKTKRTNQNSSPTMTFSSCSFCIYAANDVISGLSDSWHVPRRVLLLTPCETGHVCCLKNRIPNPGPQSNGTVC